MEGVSVWKIIKLYVVVLASVIRKISTLEPAWNDCEFVCKCMCLENKHDDLSQLRLVHTFRRKVCAFVGEGQWRVPITRHYWPYESSIYGVAFNYVVSDIAFSSFDIFLRIDGSWIFNRRGHMLDIEVSVTAPSKWTNKFQLG